MKIKQKQAESFREELIKNGFKEVVRRYTVGDYSKTVRTLNIDGKQFDFVVVIRITMYKADYSIYPPEIKVKSEGNQICRFYKQMELSEIDEKVDLFANWFSGIFENLLIGKDAADLCQTCQEMDSVKQSLKKFRFKREKPYDDEDYYRFTYEKRMDANDTVRFSYMFTKFLRHYYYHGFEVYLNELDDCGTADCVIEFSKSYDWSAFELDNLLDSFYKFIKETFFNKK